MNGIQFRQTEAFIRHRSHCDKGLVSKRADDSFCLSGGPPGHGCYGPRLFREKKETEELKCGIPQPELQKLLSWTDPDRLERLDLQQAEALIASVAESFRKQGDRRGVFPCAYLAMTRESVEFIKELSDPEAAKARSLTTDFARRYLSGLGDHLRGYPSEAWDTYYAQATREDSNDLQVFLCGATAHLVNDLPKSIACSGMRGLEDKELFLKCAARRWNRPRRG